MRDFLSVGQGAIALSPCNSTANVGNVFVLSLDKDGSESLSKTGDPS